MMRVTSLLLFAAFAAAQENPLVHGLEAYAKGDYATAERELRQALKKGPDEKASAFLGLTLAATGHCEEAGPALVKAFDTGGKDVSRLAGMALAQCHMAANRLDEAWAVVAELKSKYPSDADVLYQAARLHLRGWNEAIRQLYLKDPSSFRVNQISGEILEIQGQFAEAAMEYRKAIEKSPKTLNLHFRLGRALLMSSHAPETLEAAKKEFEAELALNPADAVAEYQVAQVLQVQQKPVEAAARLQRAITLNPAFPEALIALGKIRLDEKKSEEAIELLQRAVTLVPKSEAAHYSLMMAYRNAGRMDKAKSEKAVLDELQKAPEGEFTDFLKKLGEKQPTKK
jgi:tetratricopeptide (TPR) repeat protein